MVKGINISDGIFKKMSFSKDEKNMSWSEYLTFLNDELNQKILVEQENKELRELLKITHEIKLSGEEIFVSKLANSLRGKCSQCGKDFEYYIWKHEEM